MPSRAVPNPGAGTSLLGKYCNYKLQRVRSDETMNKSLNLPDEVCGRNVQCRTHLAGPHHFCLFLPFRNKNVDNSRSETTTFLTLCRCSGPRWGLCVSPRRRCHGSPRPGITAALVTGTKTRPLRETPMRRCLLCSPPALVVPPDLWP